MCELQNQWAENGRPDHQPIEDHLSTPGSIAAIDADRRDGTKEEDEDDVAADEVA